LIVACLFTEVMESNEALIITGNYLLHLFPSKSFSLTKLDSSTLKVVNSIVLILVTAILFALRETLWIELRVMLMAEDYAR
jgi:hypothetical protein